jgi:uncharacterized protein YecE (DUF72 family)
MKPRTRPTWSIGTVGFFYPEWAGTLYAGVGRGAGHRLTTYAQHFNAAEINSTFYGVPTSKTVQGWAEATPPEFRFCVKMPRDVTHGPTPPGALASADGPPTGHLVQSATIDMARRLIETVKPLGEKLGAVLVQFPPKFGPERLEELGGFLDRLGRDVPIAVELRNAGWWTGETEKMLKDRGVSWVAADESPQKFAAREPDPDGQDERSPRAIVATSDFLYVRWLGKHGQFRDRSREHFDPTERLRWWTKRLEKTLEEHPKIRTVFGYFDNDFAGDAPVTARRLMEMVGLETPKSERPSGGERTLFD